MDQQTPDTGSLPQLVWQRSAAAAPYHGLLIFAGQILLVLLVPLVDRGEQSTPFLVGLAAVSMALVTLGLLGYRRLPLVMGVTAVLAFLWAQSYREASFHGRGPAIAVLVIAYSVTVYLSVDYAFNAEIRPSQRILCGVIASLGLGTYRLAENLEGGRALRWVDFFWLSFSTLTTAGFGDVSPVGAWPCAVSTLEALCGILYPATLIARIASLPAPGESGKCW